MPSLKNNQAGWVKETRRDLQLKVALFLASPFLSMLYSLRTLNRKSSFVFLYMFCLFFGMALTTASGKTEVFTSDSASYRLKFDIWFNYYDANKFWEGLWDFLSFDGVNKDYYFEVLAFGLTRLTDNYHYFFLVVAAIYAFFMLKSLRYLVTLREFKVTIPAFILVYFFLDKGIFEINGVRFWTAYWVAIFSLFKIYVEKNNGYYFLALVTPFFHGAYWVFLGILLLHRILRRQENILIPFFVFSIFFGLVSLQLIEYIAKYLPSFLQQMVEAYTDAEYMEFRSAAGGYGWLMMTVLNYTKFAVVNLLVYLFIMNQHKIEKSDRDIFTFLLLWLAVFNMLINVPSLGWRFFPLAYPFIAYLWLRVFGIYQFRRLLLLLPVAFSWDLVDYYRSVQTYVPSDLFYQNPVILIHTFLFE